MPSKSDHIRRAKLNEEFGHHVLKGDQKYAYWAVVAFGYSALHWVDAYIDHKMGLHPRNHGTRLDFVSKDSLLKRHVHNDYRQVMTESQEARYEMHRFTKIDAQQVAADLANIRGHISPHL